MITLSKSYPKSAPLIELVDKKGLSEKEVDELRNILAATAEENLGEVMVHEIASAAENFLETHNRKPETFYEKMQNRQRHEQAALTDLREGTLFSADDALALTEKKSHGDKTPEDIAALNLKATMDLRRQLHTGERSVSVGSDSGGVDTTGTGEDWLNSLLKRQSALHMGSTEEDSNSDNEVDPQDPPRGAGGGESASRYHKEFQEISLLGRGAGGEVWKVKNSLDRRPYAIKKIRLRPTDGAFNSKIRREVTTISRLLHKNIVRYYAAWVENVNPVHKPVDDTDLGCSLLDDDGSSSIESSMLHKYGFDRNRYNDIDIQFDINAVYTGAAVDVHDDCSSSSSSSSSSDDDSSDASSSSADTVSMRTEDVAGAGGGGGGTDLSSSLGWHGLDVEFVDSAGHKAECDDGSYAQHINCSDSSVSEGKRVAMPAAAAQPVRFLYIQMEFCDATLRAAIDGGR